MKRPRPLCPRCGRKPQSASGFCKTCEQEREAIDAWRATNTGRNQ